MTRPSARPTKFVMDAMLGSLARKARALGFDTKYYTEGSDEGIVQVARSEGRVIITADRSLAVRARSRRITVLLLTGRSDGRRLAMLVATAKSSSVNLVRGSPRCSLCNGDLQTLRRADIAGMVPPSVAMRHRLFFKCGSCGQFYWKGGHWKKLRWLERVLAEVPVANVS